METNEIIDSLISKNEREKIYKIIYIGVSAYKRLWDDNKQLENSEFFSEIKTRILSFVIKRQFEKDLITKDFPFEVEIKNVNKFGNKALFLQNGLSKIKLSKTSKANKFQNSTKVPKYMLREAEINSKYQRQIKLFVLENNELEAREEKRTFMILGYGVNDRELSHIDFIIPDEYMKNSIEAFNALYEFRNTVKLSIGDEVTEKQIVALKDEAKKFITAN